MTPPGKNGRPRKGDLTDEEWQAVQEILLQPVRIHGSSLQRAALEVGLMRGMHEVSDPRSRERRKVSAAWVQDQLKLRGYASKKDLRQKLGTRPLNGKYARKLREAYDTGPRTIPSINSGGFVNGQVAEGGKPSALEVESEQGAKA